MPVLRAISVDEGAVEVVVGDGLAHAGEQRDAGAEALGLHDGEQGGGGLFGENAGVDGGLEALEASSGGGEDGLGLLTTGDGAQGAGDELGGVEDEVVGSAGGGEGGVEVSVELFGDEGELAQDAVAVGAGGGEVALGEGAVVGVAEGWAAGREVGVFGGEGVGPGAQGRGVGVGAAQEGQGGGGEQEPCALDHRIPQVWRPRSHARAGGREA